MSLSSSIETAPRFDSAASTAQIKTFFRRWWLPVLSLSLLCVAVWLTPAKAPVTPGRTPLQTVAHNLGHSINSLWVFISVMLLVIPSLAERWVYKRSNPWAWRALDAIFCDFLVVDAMGKDLFTSWVRPGGRHQAGFPSGHATMAFLMAWLVWQRFPKTGPLWFTMATLISWSRVESHAHYPYQVLVGALYGTGLSLLIMQREVGVLLPRVLLTDKALRRRLCRSDNRVAP